MSGATRYLWEDMPKEALKPDLARRLISTERMMLAHVYLDKGCIVPKHAHENEQLTHSRALYRRKGERMLAALERSLPAGTRWTRPQGGFFSWLTLPGTDSVALAQRAVERGVGIVPGTLFYPDGRGADEVRLSFSLVEDVRIDEGIEKLGALL